jgi:multiple sugar transport system substrate-binding protein
MIGTFAAAQEEVTIVFWSHGYDPRVVIDEEIIEQFEADNPGVTVEYYVGPGTDVDYITQLFTAISGGEGPDLFNVLNLGVPELIESGIVAPVNAEAAGFESTEALIESYLPGTLDDFLGADGELYGLPTEVANYALYINAQLFEEAGLDPVEDAPETWEELLALADVLTITDDSGNITQRAFDFAYPLPDEVASPVITYASMAHQLGGNILNEDGTEATVNTQEWADALAFIRDYGAEYGGPDYASSSIGFYEGNVAMVVSGPWYIGLVGANNPELVESVVTAPLPRWEESTVNDVGSYLYAYGLYVSAVADPAVQEAAWALAGALTNAPERYVLEANLLQPRTTVLENEDVQGSFTGPFIEDMSGPYLPIIGDVTETTLIFYRAMDRVLYEDVDPLESLQIANDELNDILGG